MGFTTNTFDTTLDQARWVGQRSNSFIFRVVDADGFNRGTITPIAAVFYALAPSLGIRGSAGVVGAVCVVVAMAAVLATPETFDRDLDYVET